MKPKKISIKVSHLPISLFKECPEAIALPVLDRILAKPEREKMILGAKVIVLSTTGLSNAIIIELQKKFEGNLPEIVQIDIPEPSKSFIVSFTNDRLDICEEEFSKHKETFDLALHAFAIEAKRQIADIYREQAPYLDEPVTLIMEAFLLASLSKLLQEPEKEESDKENFDDEEFSKVHPMN